MNNTKKQKKKFIKFGDALKIQKESGELLKANRELSKQNKEEKKNWKKNRRIWNKTKWKRRFREKIKREDQTIRRRITKSQKS